MRFAARRFGDGGDGGDRGDGPPEPGRGAEPLAIWLREQLRDGGLRATGPALEDWGCLLDVETSEGRFILGCGPVDGSDDRWLVFVEPRAPGWARLLGRRRVRPGALAGVCKALHEALTADPTVAALEWFRADPRSGAESDHASTPF